MSRLLRRRSLDPRSTLVLTLLAAIGLWSRNGWTWVPAALVIGLLLAALDAALVRAIAIAVMAGTVWAVESVLPGAVSGPVVAVTAVAVQYLVRFGLVLAIVAHLVHSTSPAQLAYALRAAHVPRVVVIPVTVMMRFLPVIGFESVAVAEALRLRGLATWREVLRHPVLTVERFTVPMISSSLRVAEDLSAAALLRGFGSTTRPTALTPPRPGLADAGIAVVLVAAIVITLTGPIG